jgi:polar amino acid transport system substrate-binding protein
MLLAAASLLAIGAFAATGCGDDDEDDGGEPAATEPAATEPAGGETPATGKIDISGVPELVDGTLNIGSDIAYAPIEFYDENNKAVGLDIDLANAMAAVLGIEVEFENAGFDTLLPALDAERYDAIMSAMTASDERKQTVDFVEYVNAGSGIIIAAAAKGIASADDLRQTVAVRRAPCRPVPAGHGRRAGAGQGADAGKGPITVRVRHRPGAVQR